MHKKCISLGWITPKMLNINTKLVNDHLWSLARSHIERMDNERCPNEKIKCIQRAYSILNNCIMFCSGKNEGAGVDDIVPIMTFILIKAKPKRIFSSMNYIRVLTNPSKMIETQGFLLTQIEMCVNFVMNASFKEFKMDEEEFLNNCLRCEKNEGMSEKRKKRSRGSKKRSSVMASMI